MPSAVRAPVESSAPVGVDVRLLGLEVWVLKVLACQSLLTVAGLFVLHQALLAILLGHVVASLPAGRRAMLAVLASPVGHWLGLIAPDTALLRALAFVLRLTVTLALGVVAGPVEIVRAAIRMAVLRGHGARSPRWWAV